LSNRTNFRDLENWKNIDWFRLNPAITLVVILLLMASGFAAGAYVAALIYLPFYNGSEPDLLLALSNVQDHPELELVTYGIQAGATIGGLLIAPFIFLKVCQRSISNLFVKQGLEVVPVLVVSFMVIILMIINSIVIDWSSNFEFPSFLKGFEHWVCEQEHAVLKTEMLNKFDSSAELLIAFLVIAVLPGIGEELVFRGLIQNELYRGTKNIQVSIWIAAAIFSALHMQFFGFVPRLLFGALFGYLYYWSGNLSFAMLAHLIFNGVTLVFLYFYQKYSFEIGIESPVAMLTSAGLAGGLLFYFYKYFESRKPPVDQL